MVLAILLMAAAAAGGDDGIVAKGSLVVGSGVITAFLAWLTEKKRWAEKEQKLRAEIANELRIKITNDPLSVEQSSYQAAMKSNAKDHENLFLRMSSVEKDVAGIKADNAAQNRLLDRMVNRIDALYDRIILGGKKK